MANKITISDAVDSSDSYVAASSKAVSNLMDDIIIAVTNAVYSSGDDSSGGDDVITNDAYNVLATRIEEVFDTANSKVSSVNNIFPVNGNVTIDVGITSINGVSPDVNGNVTLTNVLPGTVIAFAGSPNSLDGYLLCNGAVISRATYANLFNAIGTIYGVGDGSSTFSIPNLTDRFIQGSETVGVVKNAGLPNITGRIGGTLDDSWGQANGAFYESGSLPDSGGSQSGPIIWMDASRSSSIYGSSTTVQPPALTMRFYIKY